VLRRQNRRIARTANSSLIFVVERKCFVENSKKMAPRHHHHQLKKKKKKKTTEELLRQTSLL
jgi:hypothetical protein